MNCSCSIVCTSSAALSAVTNCCMVELLIIAAMYRYSYSVAMPVLRSLSFCMHECTKLYKSLGRKIHVHAFHASLTKCELQQVWMLCRLHFPVHRVHQLLEFKDNNACPMQESMHIETTVMLPPFGDSILTHVTPTTSSIWHISLPPVQVELVVV